MMQATSGMSLGGGPPRKIKGQVRAPLAGAHRAGSAGIACLMRLEGLGLAAATARAQAARPIIEPIHYLEYLLTRFEQALNAERLRRGEAS